MFYFNRRRWWETKVRHRGRDLCRSLEGECLCRFGIAIDMIFMHFRNVVTLVHVNVVTLLTGIEIVLLLIHRTAGGKRGLSGSPDEPDNDGYMCFFLTLMNS